MSKLMVPGLSISDLGSLLTMAWTCISFTPAFIAADLPFESLDIVYLVSGMQHFTFTRVSSCITAMITVERCLSVVVPLKVTVLLDRYGNNAIVIICLCTIMILYVLANQLVPPSSGYALDTVDCMITSTN